MGKIPTKGDKFTVAIVHAILFSIIFSIVFHIFSKSGKYKEGLELKYCEKSVGGTCEPVRTRCSGTGKCTTTKSGKTTCDTKCTTTGGRCDPVRTQADTKACSGEYDKCNNTNGRFVCQNNEGVSLNIGGNYTLEDRVACTRNEDCKSTKCDRRSPGVKSCRPRVPTSGLTSTCNNWRIDDDWHIRGNCSTGGVAVVGSDGDRVEANMDIAGGFPNVIVNCNGILYANECPK